MFNEPKFTLKVTPQKEEPFNISASLWLQDIEVIAATTSLENLSRMLDRDDFAVEVENEIECSNFTALTMADFLSIASSHNKTHAQQSAAIQNRRYTDYRNRIMAGMGVIESGIKSDIPFDLIRLHNAIHKEKEDIERITDMEAIPF